ncbi:putative metal-sulfur cluster biosynthetic enzyme [Frankia canadensis]|uniref:Putative metal-sulfur cluster biosynthetic enzyme n=1 Tax=Frankia canadensis TaxID=1836972 RepID=A0A2I2KIY9_9ACTN|nr:metal-sulfur cluster assembly factor [Frankia canadensis]SNQ45624.1 putative metal-sulfur cluster biosynthetic enzyme [Frankia canadensis]SOU52914.1 putative metal-sulfur cluster biosynthetic enzyme [Frankia canadensis]
MTEAPDQNAEGTPTGGVATATAQAAPADATAESGSAAAHTTVAERAAGLELAAFDDIEEAMRDVVDPELGINVVDLGLVYGIHVADDNTVTLDMTLTSAACPLTDVIEDQTRSALVDGPDGLAADVTINWVWMPPWGPDKITDEGREQLRALGFNV